MADIYTIILIIFIIIFILSGIIFFTYQDEIKKIESSICKNKKFSVLDINHEDSPEEAADILCDVNKKTQIFINFLANKYTLENERVKKLLKYYQYEDLIESKSETYTEDKLKGSSDKIYICMRDVKTGNLYNNNLILFVLLHELTHVIDTNWNITSDHSQSFWELNARVLLEAKECGIYNAIDYSLNPVEYCNGVNINSNPMLDFELVSAGKLILF